MNAEDTVLLRQKRHRVRRWWQAVRIALTFLGEEQTEVRAELRQLAVALRQAADQETKDGT